MPETESHHVFASSQSKISKEVVEKAVEKILKAAEEKKRNFVETIELQVALKNYDPVKDKRFAGTIRLPHIPRERYNVCVLGTDKDCDAAKMINVPCMSVADLTKLNKNKKLVKKMGSHTLILLHIVSTTFSAHLLQTNLKSVSVHFSSSPTPSLFVAASHSAFLASASLIRKIPRLLGPGLNKAGKFPTVLTAESLQVNVDNLKAAVKFQLKSKKTTCMGVAVGSVALSKAENVTNILTAVNFLVSLLPKNWQQVP